MGEDAKGFLDNLVTNDIELLDRQRAIHAALLTPQGKILFAFFIVPRGDGFLLETARSSVPALMKRLTLYRLRAKVTFEDLSDRTAVLAAWGPDGALPPGAVAWPDPRDGRLGSRIIVALDQVPEASADVADYDLRRVALRVPEAGRDYVLGDTFPHEARMDLLAGVSFTKGCYVGQEVVARMQHKTVVRKRVVRIAADGALREGSDILVGEAVIGRVGTVAGSSALAMLRLDRALEAKDKGLVLTADGVDLAVHDEDLGAYAAAAARP
jgi:folate-binding protein YgfZ